MPRISADLQSAENRRVAQLAEQFATNERMKVQILPRRPRTRQASCPFRRRGTDFGFGAGWFRPVISLTAAEPFWPGVPLWRVGDLIPTWTFSPAGRVARQLTSAGILTCTVAAGLFLLKTKRRSGPRCGTNLLNSLGSYTRRLASLLADTVSGDGSPPGLQRPRSPLALERKYRQGVRLPDASQVGSTPTCIF